MKSTFKKLLALLLLTIICLSAVSCDTDTASAYSALYDHLKAKVGVGTATRLPYEEEKITPFAYIEKTESGEEILYLSIQDLSGGQNTGYRIDIKFEPGNPDSLTWIYRIANNSTTIARAEAKLDLRSYTGTELIDFTSSNGIPLSELTTHRVYATDMTNAALLALDQYCAEQNLGISVTDLGFVSLSSSFLHADKANDDFSDLGGAFSGARLSYALRMTLLGVTMVFAVLGLLWAVLSLFKKVFAQPEKTSDKATVPSSEPAPAPVATPEPVAASDDGATVAAITAAIAAMIESDPELRDQFAGGFRVVSFKKKSGKTAWNS